MKKIAVVFLTLFVFISAGVAQRFAYVDTEYILSNIPTYESAKSQIDQFSADWQKEIELLYDEIDKMDKAYQAEKVLLTQEMRKKEEDKIKAKLKEVKELQKKYFGQEGELFKKRQELVKPLQDEIFNAIKEIAEESNFSIIFDTASSANILYTDPKYDKSDDVLKKLGYKD